MAGLGGVGRLNRAEAERLAEAYTGEWVVVEKVSRVVEEIPPPPYTTADLLADAARRLGWRAEETAQVAQALYENGWITYPRTDSRRVSAAGVEVARRAVVKEYGEEWLGREQTFEGENGQDAHEAIRPVDPTVSADSITDPQQSVLYRLIRARFLAAYMRPARVKEVTITLEKVDGTESEGQ